MLTYQVVNPVGEGVASESTAPTWRVGQTGARLAVLCDGAECVAAVARRCVDHYGAEDPGRRQLARGTAVVTDQHRRAIPD